MILPQTEWVQKTEYPDLRDYDEIAIDLETRDPGLKKKGSNMRAHLNLSLAIASRVRIDAFRSIELRMYSSSSIFPINIQ